MKKEFVYYPVGLIVGSFGLEIASLWLNVPQKVITGTFWVGIALLGLVVVTRVLLWLKEFVKEMRA